MQAWFVLHTFPGQSECSVIEFPGQLPTSGETHSTYITGKDTFVEWELAVAFGGGISLRSIAFGGYMIQVMSQMSDVCEHSVVSSVPDTVLRVIPCTLQLKAQSLWDTAGSQNWLWRQANERHQGGQYVWKREYGDEEAKFKSGDALAVTTKDRDLNGIILFREEISTGTWSVDLYSVQEIRNDRFCTDIVTYDSSTFPDELTAAHFETVLGCLREV